MLENENDSLNYRAMHEHYAHLRLHLRIEDNDIQQLKAAICTPYDRSDNIHAFVKAQLNNLRRLTAANHPLNNSIAVELMKKAYAATEVDRADFENCFDKFITDNPLEVNRTPAALATAVSDYVVHILQHFVAKRKALEAARMPRAHIAQEAPAAAAHPAPVVAAAAVAQPIQQHQGRGGQQGRGAQQGRGGRGGGGRGPAAAAPAPPPVGQPRAYCHTHGGPAPGQRGHHSVACRNPGPSHEWYATFSNQMGGPPAV